MTTKSNIPIICFFFLLEIIPLSLFSQDYIRFGWSNRQMTPEQIWFFFKFVLLFLQKLARRLEIKQKIAKTNRKKNFSRKLLLYRNCEIPNPRFNIQINGTAHSANKEMRNMLKCKTVKIRLIN